MFEKPREVATGLSQWGRLSARAVREDGWSGVGEATRSFYTGLWRLYGMVHNYGTPIYDREWDLLVVLDACRADLMAEVVGEYDFLSDGTEDSMGSCSPEWMEKNFTDEYAAEMAETAYVTGNPYSRSTLDPSAFALVDEVWRDRWDDDDGTIHPDAITDRAIRVHREHRPGRLLVHYMQPHHPFVPNPLGEGADTELDGTDFGEKATVWNRLRAGELTREEVWEAYRANLRYALDSVEVLLENVDAPVAVVTADHGNALGEHHMYGHPIYAPIEALKRVPWCVTTAMDTGSYEPPADTTADESEDHHAAVERKLEDLGYL